MDSSSSNDITASWSGDPPPEQTKNRLGEIGQGDVLTTRGMDITAYGRAINLKPTNEQTLLEDFGKTRINIFTKRTLIAFIKEGQVPFISK